MPRYFINLCDEKGMTPDEEGVDLPDDEAARREAEATASLLLNALIALHEVVDTRYVEVTNRDGVPVATIKLRDLIH